MQHLDGDVAIVLEVVCEEHGGHAASANFSLDAVTAGQRGREAFGRRHGATSREHDATTRDHRTVTELHARATGSRSIFGQDGSMAM